MGKVETMNKTTRKSKRRLKRQIRKTLAAVFMITAIVVAAIPVDKINAETPGGGGGAAPAPIVIEPSQPYEYPTNIASKFIPQPGVELSYDKAKTANASLPEGTTYYMIYDNANQVYQMQWRYKYYVQTVDGTTYGIIYKYNNVNAVDSLTITSKETTHYITVGNTEYETFVTKYKTTNPIEYRYSFADYNSKISNDSSRMIAKFRPTQWSEFQTQCFNAANHVAGATEPADLILSSADLTEEEYLSYYCEMTKANFGQTSPTLTGCTLNVIYDLTQKKPDGKYEQIYVVKKTGETAAGVTYEADTQFVYNETVSIVGIGEKTFQNIQNVASYTIESGVTYIGDNSFEGSSAKEIDFKSGVQYIGNQSFKNCQLLNKVTFSDDNINIGAEAFYGTAITELVLPGLVKNIGVGAFASCDSLTDVDFSKINYNDSVNKVGCIVQEGAFYNDYAINNLKFFAGSKACTITSIGDGCFAVDHSVSSSLTEITLPSMIDKKEGLGDKLFYNRNNLKKLTMPSEFGYHTPQVIPDDFLVGVKNLEELVFLDTSANVTYTTSNEGKLNEPDQKYYNHALFRDIVNDKFVVRGPARDSQSLLVAQVRSCTWNAYFNDEKKTPIPYVYTDDTGVDVYEIATGENNAYIMSVNKNGELTNCEINTNSGLSSDAVVDFTIPSTVGKYNITSISTGCFAKFKNNIGTLRTGDDSVQIIDAEAFSDCPNLTAVYLGDSITQIGAKAFTNCPKLENVYFRTPDCGYEAFEIGTAAFQTKSKKLYFHGDINAEYDAFQYAMAADNWVDDSVNTNQISICYKSDYVVNDKPTFLTVLKERYKLDDGTIATRATLVDYLHYEELPSLPDTLLKDAFDITDKWPDIMYKYESGTGVTPKEEEIIDSTINIVIPSGIESIDVKEFLASGLNSGNISTYLHNSLGYVDTVNADNYYAKYDYAIKPVFVAEGIVKYHIRLEDNYSYIEYPDASGNYPENQKVVIKPYNTSVKNFDSFNESSPTNWELNGWKAVCSDPSFALGSAAYSQTDLTFNMPGADVSIYTIYSPLYTETINNINGSENGREVVVEATKTLVSKNLKITYTFNNWEIKVYRDANANDQVADGNWEGHVTNSVGGDINFASSELKLNVDEGYLVLLTAHYNASNLGVSYVSYGQSGIRNYAASSKKVTSKIYPDYYYNYLDYGLFNGYYGYENSNDPYVYSAREFGSTSNKAALEQVDIGNDFIKSVSMSTVKYLPDYCFNSCEQLESINLGTAIEHIGSAAFTGCDKLTGLSSSGKYVSQNGILYYANDDGTYKIIECLTSRGAGVGSNTYPDNNDIDLTKIVEIADGAFEGCKNITTVDLSKGTNITTIPQNAFKNCTGLQKALLPRTVTTIETGAFENTDHAYVTIPTLVLEIQDNAFSAGETIRSYQNGSGFYYTQKFKDVYFEAIDVSYTVDFLDWDGKKLCDTQYIEPGKNATPPEDPKREGYKFIGWNGQYLGVDKDTLVMATYELIKEETPETPTYTLDVDMGNGDGKYAEGTKVVITAYDPFDGYEFEKWTSDSTDFNIVDANVYLTTITMPAHDLSIKANYKPKKTDGTNGNNGNNSGTNSNNNQNGSTTSGNNRPGGGSGSGGSGSGSGSGNGSANGGTVVDIDKDGISNSGVSSAIVNGSTDNFIVKITDSSAATEAVRQALINEYGSLENIAYMAMDISLYDSTGTTKITDTKGISVTITIPIPDALIQYSGNNKAAGVVDSLNGYALDKLGAKFSTIDGISCITFTATHFSPYTIYVDKNNLSYSQTLDDSPTTGDGIHPKWFLSIGLAALSVFLFFKKDRKPIRRTRMA